MYACMYKYICIYMWVCIQYKSLCTNNIMVCGRNTRPGGEWSAEWLHRPLVHVGSLREVTVLSPTARPLLQYSSLSAQQSSSGPKPVLPLRLGLGLGVITNLSYLILRYLDPESIGAEVGLKERIPTMILSWKYLM